MKFILCSDCHFTSLQPVGRKDDILEASTKKWAAILALAKKETATVLLAGDMCDRPRDWYLLPELMAICKEYADVPIYAVFGQHDMYMRNENRHATVLGVLGQAGLIKILTAKGAWFGANRPDKPWCVHGCSWGETIPKIEQQSPLNQRYSPKHALVIHAPIAKEEVYPGHNFTDTSTMFRKYPEYDLIICGDVHRRFLAIGPKNQLIINTGPIVRLEADDYTIALKPAVVLYDANTGKYEWKHLPAEMGMQVLTQSHLKAKEERKMLLDTFISSIDASKAICRSKMADRLMQWMKENRVEYSQVVDLLTDVCQLPEDNL